MTGPFLFVVSIVGLAWSLADWPGGSIVNSPVYLGEEIVALFAGIGALALSHGSGHAANGGRVLTVFGLLLLVMSILRVPSQWFLGYPTYRWEEWIAFLLVIAGHLLLCHHRHST